METSIISSKQFKWVFLFSLLVLLFSVLKGLFFTQNSLTVCAEGGSLSVIIQTEKSERMIVSNASAKNTLHCIGKGLPFYTRKIEYAHVKDALVRQELSARYDVQSWEIPESIGDGIEVQMVDSRVVTVITRTAQYVFLLKKLSSPYEIREHTMSSSTEIFTPKVSEVYVNLLEEIISIYGAKVRVMRDGEIHVREL